MERISSETCFLKVSWINWATCGWKDCCMNVAIFCNSVSDRVTCVSVVLLFHPLHQHSLPCPCFQIMISLIYQSLLPTVILIHDSSWCQYKHQVTWVVAFCCSQRSRSAYHSCHYVTFRYHGWNVEYDYISFTLLFCVFVFFQYLSSVM